MSERVKLTKGQAKYLAILGQEKSRVVRHTYKPMVKLVSLGLARYEASAYRLYPRAVITDAGLAYLAEAKA
jgi:hypothetical protein